MCGTYGKGKFFMTVNFSADYPQLRNVSALKTGAGVQNTQKAPSKNDDSILSDKCTDGKDDGQIGLLNAAGHIVKGAGNTLINTVKGCFTDEKGDLSIGKTLLTLGTAAACIAFPPLGLAACAAGAAVGAVKVGHGIYNAATAKTDAEAKKAWQEVGGGAVTAGASAVGAKSSLGALKATSTAGKAGTSALGELEENATIAQKFSAFGKDAVSSTKNNASGIKEAAGAKIETAKEAIDLSALKTKAEGLASSVKDAAGKPVQAAKNGLDKIKNIKLSDVKSAITEGAENSVQVAKSGLDKIKNINLSDLKVKLSDKAQLAFNAIKEIGYSEALKKYGYEAVHEALTAAAGATVADKAI